MQTDGVRRVRLPSPAPGWQGDGILLRRLARRIHDHLLAGRDEAYVSLMVNASAGDGKVQRVYESWGYEVIGTSRPSPESPVLTAMIRPTGTGV